MLSSDMIELQLLADVHMPAIAHVVEDAAAGHRALIDVQRDRSTGVAGVADGVVLVRRDQAAGGTRAGDQAADFGEPVAVSRAFAEIVLGDFQLAVPDAFDAPQPVMVVDGRALARAPGHGDHAIPMLRTDVDLAARVMALNRFQHAGG